MVKKKGLSALFLFMKTLKRILAVIFIISSALIFRVIWKKVDYEICGDYKVAIFKNRFTGKKRVEANKGF